MLHLHRSERADLLVEALGDVLSRPLAGPLSPEVVSVPTRGVERWITQRLSLRLGASLGDDDGVCANLAFPFPGRLVGEVAASACGCRATDDWWAPERTVWPLMALVDEHMDDARLAPLAQHLRASSPVGPDGQVRRYGTVRHVADLYDRYGVHRPSMLTRWRATGPSSPDESLGEDVWQAHLWLMLRALTALPSPAERFEAAPSVLSADPGSVLLPERFSVFGLTRLPASYLGVLRALAEHRDVHLFLLHPSGVMWDRVSAALGQAPLAGPLRRQDHTDRLPAHPLLRSWARDAREMQLVLASQRGAPAGRESYRPVAEVATTLLGLVQQGIRSDTAPPGPPAAGDPDHRPVLAPEDQSLVVHSCHGRARQVEVAREAVLHLMAQDPTLEPRDTIIMCPDIELFAPLVQAAFGPGAAALVPTAYSPDHGAGTGAPVELRARLADRSLRQTNPMLAVAGRLLQMAGGRATASSVVDLASQAPVSRRFDLDEEGLAAFQRWVAGTGVHWGIDPAHRRPWKLEGLKEGTWQEGLDRLALGVAMAGRADQVYACLLPFSDISGPEVDVVGRVCELVDRLKAAFERLSGSLSASRWASALVQSTLELAAPTPGEPWEAEQLRQALEHVAVRAGEHVGPYGHDEPLLDLAEARALFGAAVAGRPTRANFRTGDMTVCTLVPMRSVPHRVVCLVGLDDGVFPRRSAQDGDDLLGTLPHIGDRDGPHEDRQLLLDAVLAATQHLVITYEGHDQHLNQRRPPAVTVDELLDVVDQTVRVAGGARLPRQQIVVEHPLQPFDPRNYTPGELLGRSAWRFDDVNLGGARALSAGQRPAPAFLPVPLGPLPGTTVQLASLVRFLEHPVKAFLRERLGYFGADVAQRLCDPLPIELPPLERWSLGDRLLDAYMSQGTLGPALDAELGRGQLPPGPLREPVLRDVVPVVQYLAGELSSLPEAAVPAEAVEVALCLPDGSSLVGRVPGVRDGTVVRCTFSKTRAKHRLRAWAHFLALSAMCPERGPAAVTIAQAEGSRPARPRVSVSRLRRFDGDDAQRRVTALSTLQQLVDLYRLGMCEPLPLYCGTSAAWAEARYQGTDAVHAAQQVWGPSDIDERPSEAAEPEHVLVLGGRIGFPGLLADPPGTEAPGATGLAASERSRFGRLALALWEPLLDHEQRSER